MITPVIDQASIQALAWSLVHFVWQGAVLSLVAFAVFRLPRLRATTRYVAGIATLAAMLASPIATFLYLTRTVTDPVASRVAEAAPPFRTASTAAVEAGPYLQRPSAVATAPAVTETESASIGPFVILTVWLSGVILLSLRLLGGWIVARRLITRAIRPVSPEIHSLVRRVAGRMALDRIVRVFESSAVSVPVMVGWIKPVVLLPAAALSGLTPTQVEALIAHELAHVRRHDYLVNLLQSVVETLLFYHPAVWWVSARVRAEREHCCDDLAVGVCDRLVYVTALADLAAMTTTPRIALAATDGSLVNRVRRLLGRSRDSRDSGSSWMPAVVLALAVGTMVPASYVLARGNERGQEPRGTYARAARAESAPALAIEQAVARRRRRRSYWRRRRRSHWRRLRRDPGRGSGWCRRWGHRTTCRPFGRGRGRRTRAVADRARWEQPMAPGETGHAASSGRDQMAARAGCRRQAAGRPRRSDPNRP